MSIYNNRVCRACGITFSGGPRAWYCPSCRAERKRERERLHKQRGTNRPLGSTDYCKACGKPYIVNGGLQKYCPKCAPEQHAEFDRKQSLELYEKNKELINSKRYAERAIDLSELTCAICGKKFSGYKNQKVCSEKCRKEYIKMRAREYERNSPGRMDGKRIPNLSEVTCVICGNQFFGKKNQKTCSEECRKEYNKLRGREKEHRRSEQIKKKRESEKQEESQT